MFIPYEELRAEFTATNDRVKLLTPWASVDAETPTEIREEVARICSAINARETAPIASEVSEFLEAFEDHYVAYLAPRALPFVPSQSSRTPQRLRLDASAPPLAWLEAYAPAAAGAKIDASWELDASALLEASRIGDTDRCDPHAAYRIIMRWAFSWITSRSGDRGAFFRYLEQAQKEDEPRFFRAAEYYVRQYHHVTSTSFDSLIPAIETLPFASDLVSHLAFEERGHGSFTTSSLKGLGVAEPALLPLSPYAVAVMDFLKVSAHLNPLAFSCLFNLFELPGEQDEDPLGALLAKSSRPAAAKGLQAHFKLNKDGAHFTNGFHLVREMGAVDAYSVLEAARFAELHFLLIEGNCQEAVAYAERAH